ncbi:replication region DNA-binding N-term [Variovorax sp. HW608]|uniref:DNA-binding protein n=1 Tax=Variovorax sp. HW608 TaxID=1034889 RepID=UPI0008200649|nr:DNA-binding protein [Variovorax sp. HW608]SCK54387.1 replication region DNA-binding N-term [Variovorax sp. HW608]
MEPRTAGVSASTPTSMPPIRRRGPRGVQQEEVAQAADALLAQGLKPTIERVRQHLGGGSPNTVSPMLDVWFAALAARMADASEPVEDDLPPSLRGAWNHAKHEARAIADQALQDERAALEQSREQLSLDQEALVAREEQLMATKAALDSALAETRQTCDALRAELAQAQNDIAVVRSRYESEVEKLRGTNAQLQRDAVVLRDEHAQALSSRETAWTQERQRTQEREAAHERRFLTEVDQARQAAKAIEAQLIKERKRWSQWEEAADAERKAQRAAAVAARESEDELHEQLLEQSTALARAEATSRGLEEQLVATREQLMDEKGAHSAARAALAQAIAAVAQRASTPKRSSRRG